MDRFLVYIHDGELFEFSPAHFESAYEKDRSIAERIGISRQAAHQYCQGAMQPSSDRAAVLYELAPESFVRIK